MNLQPSQHTPVAQAFPIIESRPVILTVEQLAARNPAFTESAIRNHIFKAATRQSSKGEIPGNGLAESGAIIRLGGRVLLDESKFLAWVTRGGRTE